MGTRMPGGAAHAGAWAEAGIDRIYMSAIARGTRNISVPTLANIAQALGVPISSLLR